MRAAVVQLNATADVEHNLETADRLVRKAVEQRAQLVVLPEKWPLLATGQVARDGAEPPDGPALSWARAIAAELAIDLVAGSVSLRGDSPDARFNTSVHIGPDGRDRASYRKLHMFDVEIDGVVYRESDDEQAGDEVVVSALDGGVGLGMSICYDLRFPELFRELSARGAQVVSIPSAFTFATTRDHWEPLLRARAIENQVFVLAANQVGEHSPGRRSGGRSMIVDPWGIVLAQAADTESAIVAELDFARQDRIREELPALGHRKPQELYRQRDVVSTR